MIKKYIQLFLLVNFCLTAMSFANSSASDIHENVKTVLTDQFDQILTDQFDQIWNNLNRINEIYEMYRGYGLLEVFISDHKNRSFQYNQKNMLPVNSDKIRHRLNDLYIFFSENKLYLQGISSSHKIELNNLMENIQIDLFKIRNLYKNKLFSEWNKALLNDQLVFIDEVKNFLLKTSNSTKLFLKQKVPGRASTLENHENTISFNHSNDIRELLERWKEEDALIYAQYETVINCIPIKDDEIKIEDFSTDSQANKNIFVYFNRNENLIEINHVKDDKNSYATIWQICPSDVSLVNWDENDPITINKNNIFSKYSINAKRFDYTLGNNKTSVRANLICKSGIENIYNILGIDYYDCTVFLENGLCLFVILGDIKEWCAKDRVLLEGSESSLNKENLHKLINTTRNKQVWVSTVILGK